MPKTIEVMLSEKDFPIYMAHKSVIYLVRLAFTSAGKPKIVSLHNLYTGSRKDMQITLFNKQIEENHLVVYPLQVNDRLSTDSVRRYQEIKEISYDVILQDYVCDIDVKNYSNGICMEKYRANVGTLLEFRSFTETLVK